MEKWCPRCQRRIKDPETSGLRTYAEVWRDNRCYYCHSKMLGSESEDLNQEVPIQKDQPSLSSNDLTVFLAESVLQNPTIKRMFQELERRWPDVARTLGEANAIESIAFDVWLMTYTARASALRNLPHAELTTIIDEACLIVYRQLLEFGLTEVQIMDLQDCLARRYREYDEAYTNFWKAQNLHDPVAAAFRFAQLVIRNVFGKDTERADILMSLYFIVDAQLVSMGEVLKDVKYLEAPADPAALRGPEHRMFTKTPKLESVVPDVELASPGKSERELMSVPKVCPGCQLVNPGSAGRCNCGYVFDLSSSCDAAPSNSAGRFDRPVEQPPLKAE